MRFWGISRTVLIAAGLFCRLGAFAQSDDPATNRANVLKKLSIEELLSTQITTAGRKAQNIEEIPSATEVLSNEEIHRSGATSIPDALRLATAVEVSRAGAGSWAVSARGFNSTTADKMQVFLDGRSLYTPLFSGVFWDIQDVMLDDVDRIEITRGPSATLWGANAFSGVININTKSAKDTQGTYLNAGVGFEDQFGGVRYGGKLGEDTYYRAYAKVIQHDGLRLPSGLPAHDNEILGRTGFRVDSDLSSQNTLMAEGEYYDGRLGMVGPRDTDVNGGHFLTRWRSQMDEASELQLQGYYNFDHRHIFGLFREQLHTVDFDALYRRALNERNEIMAGLNYRIYDDMIGNENPAVLSFVPPHRSIQDINGFLQYEYKIIPDLWSVTAGSKLEYYDLSGFEYQPSIRSVWTPHEHHTVWAAVSRAVRTPTRFDTDFAIPSVNLVPSGRFKSERVIAYELGYRTHLRENLSFDISGFYNDYSDLRSQETEAGVLVLRNRLEGHGYGIENAVQYQPLSWWKIRASYTFLDKDLHPGPGSTDITAGAGEGNDPKHFGAIHSSWDLPQNLFLDAIVRYMSDLPNPHVAGYAELDLRLAWRPQPKLEVAVTGQNLLHKRHPEFGAASPLREEVERSGYIEVTWGF